MYLFFVAKKQKHSKYPHNSFFHNAQAKVRTEEMEPCYANKKIDGIIMVSVCLVILAACLGILEKDRHSQHCLQDAGSADSF